MQSNEPEAPCGTLDVPGESTVKQADRVYLVTGQAEIQSRLQTLLNPANPANLNFRNQSICWAEKNKCDSRHYRYWKSRPLMMIWNYAGRSLLSAFDSFLSSIPKYLCGAMA